MSLRGRLLVVLWTLVALGGCDAKDTRMTVPATPDMAQLKVDLAFTCTHEKDRIPPRDPEAERLYQHARWLWQGNLLKEGPAAYPTRIQTIAVNETTRPDTAVAMNQPTSPRASTV